MKAEKIRINCSLWQLSRGLCSRLNKLLVKWKYLSEWEMIKKEVLKSKVINLDFSLKEGYGCEDGRN